MTNTLLLLSSPLSSRIPLSQPFLTSSPKFRANLAQNEFLMHAIFLVTATHLQYLQPHETRHRIVALQNLSQALPGFRNAIDKLSGSKEYSMEMAEALIACSLLLLQYSWNFDSEVWNRDGTLTGLYRGMMAITLSCLDEVREGSLSPMLRYSPRLHIEQRMRIAGTAYKVDDVPLHILSCTKISNIQPENSSDFLNPIERLNSILWALGPDRSGSANLDLELPAARLVTMNDGRAQTLLLYWFAAISRLRSERFWWMKKRALYLFDEVSLGLGNRCVECTSRAHEILRRED
ncbi:hypothetical protein F5882DRAFT_403622 [Hyaloscypha sp. PMI_1271]|nr:hypothetical protein F5882DRAFT_403622 [Hyaloscypha sp. PMI_1271]